MLNQYSGLAEAFGPKHVVTADRKNFELVTAKGEQGREIEVRGINMWAYSGSECAGEELKEDIVKGEMTRIQNGGGNEGKRAEISG